MTPETLLVFTGSRADYGIMRPLLRLIEQSPIDLALLVSGSHLSIRHGETATEVERDGYAVSARIPVLSDAGKQPAQDCSVAAAIGTGIERYAAELQRSRPHAALVLGDRFEAFAFAVACHTEGVPLAHLHGGEVTSGAMDDGFRHSMSKFASLHLVANTSFGERLERMGELPSTIHAVGALGLDALRAQLENLPEPKERSQILLAYHPATLGCEAPAETAEKLVAAARATGRPILATGPNADPGGDEIREVFLSHARAGHLEYCESLGSEGFVEELNRTSVMLGNSSAGIIEAPFAGAATVNVGVRQLGRPRAASVHDCPAATPELASMIERAAATPPARLATTPYGDGHAAQAALQALTQATAWAPPIKQFNDGTV